MEIIVSLFGYDTETAFFMGSEGGGVPFADAVTEPERTVLLHAVQDAGKEPRGISFPSLLRTGFQRLQVIQVLPDPADPAVSFP